MGLGTPPPATSKGSSTCLGSTYAPGGRGTWIPRSEPCSLISSGSPPRPRQILNPGARHPPFTQATASPPWTPARTGEQVLSTSGPTHALLGALRYTKDLRTFPTLGPLHLLPTPLPSTPGPALLVHLILSSGTP